MLQPKKEIGCIISDPRKICFLNCEIVKTTRGWWKDTNKLHLFMEATIQGKKLKQACEIAGVTKKQWRRFVEVNPSFDGARRRCREILFRYDHPQYNSIFGTREIDLGQSQKPEEERIAEARRASGYRE